MNETAIVLGPEQRPKRISKTTVDAALPAKAAYRVWDSELKGFGLKISPGGVKTYFVWYRVGSGRAGVRKEFTIGRHGQLTPQAARIAATAILRDVALGADPQTSRQRGRDELTVNQLCALYFEEGVSTKKPSTIRTDKARVKAHVEPLLGKKRISTITGADIERFMRDVAKGKTAVAAKPTLKMLKAQGRKGQGLEGRRRRGEAVASGGKGAATRTVGLLGGIFSFAVRERLLKENPVQGVERYRDNKSQRFLTAPELKRLAGALDDASSSGEVSHAIAVIRLLILTGARKSEIERLKWSEVDVAWSCLRLGDGKTGGRIVQIGAAALDILTAIPRTKSIYVFPSDRVTPKELDLPFTGTPKIWERRIRSAARLPGVRLHDLRHTYASIAVASGQSLQIIGAILGHRDVKTTAQYAHLADDPVKAAANFTAAAAAAAMSGLTVVHGSPQEPRTLPPPDRGG